MMVAVKRVLSDQIYSLILLFDDFGIETQNLTAGSLLLIDDSDFYYEVRWGDWGAPASRPDALSVCLQSAFRPAPFRRGQAESRPPHHDDISRVNYCTFHCSTSDLRRSLPSVQSPLRPSVLSSPFTQLTCLPLHLQQTNPRKPQFPCPRTAQPPHRSPLTPQSHPARSPQSPPRRYNATSASPPPTPPRPSNCFSFSLPARASKARTTNSKPTPGCGRATS